MQHLCLLHCICLLKSYGMKKISLLIFCSLFLFSALSSLRAQETFYEFEKKISLPGDAGYDYLSTDQVNRRLYVSHGTSVNVIDLKTETLAGTIDGMQGNHGIAIAPELNKGFISDGKANAVVVFDINTLKTITTIMLTGKKPDAILYDSYSKNIFAFNGGSDNVSVIDPVALKEIKLIQLGGGPEFAVSDGHGKIYNNIEDKNVLKVIDSKELSVINTFPLAPCGGPTGLAFDSINNRLFSVCRENKGMSVVDVISGKVIATLPIGRGVDAVAYDAVTKLIFCSNGDGTTTIIKQVSADNYTVVQTLVTQTRAKTLALNPTTHKIYLSAFDYDQTTKKIIPGTFGVMIYRMK